MSVLYIRRARPDRGFGYVLIAIFTLGILGGLLATYLNGGHVPEVRASSLQLAKTTARV